MLILKYLWLNGCDGCVTLQDQNFVTIGDPDVILHIEELHSTTFKILQGKLYPSTIVFFYLLLAQSWPACHHAIHIKNSVM